MRICKTKRGMYGKNHTEEAKRKISKANKGEKNGVWKGDDVGNNALHGWIRRNKPKPDLCDNCKGNPPRDLHNTPGTYKRNLEDWVWLCRRCHMIEDERLEEMVKRNKDGLGKHLSEEHKRKVSLNHADNSGKNHPMYGKHPSEETKRKMSESKVGAKNPMFGKRPRLGKHLSEETKQKISDSRRCEKHKRPAEVRRLVR